MARVQTVYLNRSDVPSREALQASLKSLRLKVTLDDAYVPFKTAGYVPCTWDGEDAGCDMRFEDVGETVSPALKAALHGRDVAIVIRWSGDPREELAALSVCAALVKDAGALAPDDGSDALSSSEDLLAKIKRIEASL